MSQEVRTVGTQPRKMLEFQLIPPQSTILPSLRGRATCPARGSLIGGARVHVSLTGS